MQLAEPVNKFCDLVRSVVQCLKTVCPILGKVKIAKILARAGLHLGVTTVGRILKEKPAHQPPGVKPRVVTSKHPNRVWLADLTTLPIGSGFWISWLPFALPQCWPSAGGSGPVACGQALGRQIVVEEALTTASSFGHVAAVLLLCT